MITSPVVTTQAKIQFSISILHEISQHVIYVSKLHHHLLLSAPIKTVYVLNSVKNALHTCSSPTFHCHMTRKTHEVKLLNYFMCISSFVYDGLSSSSGSSESSIFILKTLVTVQFILKSFQFTASTTIKIKNTLIRKQNKKILHEYKDTIKTSLQAEFIEQCHLSPGMRY